MTNFELIEVYIDGFLSCLKNVLAAVPNSLGNILAAVSNWHPAILKDWQLWAVMLFVFVLYVVALAFPRVRRFTYQNAERMRYGLPSVSETSTLIGLVIAALAIVTGLVSNPQGYSVDTFKAVIISLAGSALFLFFSFFFTRFPSWWCSYLSEACSSSGWYCLTFSLFALLDVLLSTRTWRFAMLLAPTAVVIYTLKSLKNMNWRRLPKGEAMTCKWGNCSKHGPYMILGQDNRCPECVAEGTQAAS